MTRIYARVSLCLLIGLSLIGLSSGQAFASAGRRIAAPDEGPAVPDPLPFVDNFSSSTLDPGWSWFRPYTSTWSLTERPGFLRIHTQPGTLDDNSLAYNILKRSAPTVNYEVSTRVELTVTQDF